MGRLSVVIVIGLLLAGCTLAPVVPNPGPDRRAYWMISTARIAGVPTGTHRTDLWMPIPSNDDQQRVTSIVVETAQPYEIQTDSDYSNQILHVWSDKPGTISVTLHLTCIRSWQYVDFHVLPSPDSRTALWVQGSVPSDRLLQPDRLGVIDDGVRLLAAQVTAGRSDVMSKARAIYDYVIGHMVYDKITPGWGNGDTLRACQVGKGNCTDFNALFISLARASGIKARFKMGCQVPTSQHDGSISGYHCWAEFWDSKYGWVPVDPSEAWKHKSETDNCFGSLDFDRIQFSWGRDLRLPGSAGEPLNYFFAPYAEVDGKPVQVDRSLTLVSAI